MIEINDLKLRRGWFMTQDNHPTPKKKIIIIMNQQWRG